MRLASIAGPGLDHPSINDIVTVNIFLEYQTTLLLLLLCCQLYHLPQQVCNVQSATKWNSNFAYKYGHFLKSTSAYYSNCSSTFNYRLLLSGDIQTNPGPDPTVTVQNSNILTDEHVENFNSTNHSTNLSYSRNQLLQFNKNYKLSPPVWATIKILGLRKRARGSKAGNKNDPNNNAYNNPRVNPLPHPLELSDTSSTIDQSYSAPKVNFAVWNARSMRAKTSSVCELIISEKLDILGITESWLTGTYRDDPVIADFNTTLPGYDFHYVPRIGRRGGGVCICLRKSFKVRRTDIKSFKSFEYIDLVISSRYQKSLRLVIIYRPQTTKEKQRTAPIFFNEFSTFFEGIATVPHHLLIAGDFNFHMDNLQDREAAKFADFLDSAGLIQHVSGPTHTKGHTLDLILSRMTDVFISNVSSTFYLPSDHAAISSFLHIARPEPVKMEISSRKLHNIDLDAFRADILVSPLFISPSSELDLLVTQYDTVLRDLKDKYAPLITRTIRCRPNAPWYNDDLREMKCELRRLERRWNSSKLEIDKQIFKDLSNKYNLAIKHAKESFHRKQFADCDSRNLFKKFTKLSTPSQSKSLPSDSSDDVLANRFSRFFSDKIKRIKDNLGSSKSDSPKRAADSTSSCNSSFCKFSLMSEESVRDIIIKSPASSCSMDPIPTWMVKKCVDELLPIITRIINLSFLRGNFPDALKSARITPLIKKQSLDSDILKNYRPVANLTFLAKTIERACTSQIQDYLDRESLRGKMQSAYRPCFSTETALLRVYNDLLLAVDIGNEAVLILLDYSAAFDTINHDILLDRLVNRYGISDSALNWFKSYFTNRSQSIVINNSVSKPHTPLEGVPQGSVIGPLVFTMFTSPLEDIIASHGFGRMIYADDTQVYVILNHDDASLIPKLERCISDIKAWSSANDLKLNEEKTEVLHISSKFRKSSSLSSVNIASVPVEPVNSARNLGVVVTKDLSMDKYINNKCRSASYALYKIGRIRNCLDGKTTETLVHAFITCHLDQCNSLLYGLPDSLISKLQRIQNSAARLVSRTRYKDHITPVLRKLHWLPIKYRIMYKILLLTFKCLHGLAPDYLADLIHEYKPSRNLRSSSKLNLVSPSVSTISYGQRSFYHAAPKLWNDIPYHIKNSMTLGQFKSSLKTHMFTLAF